MRILFLRNKDNRTIAEVEVVLAKENEKQFVEIHSSVIIDKYSEFLLENLDKKEDIVADFTEISDLRGWLWESYFMGDENDPEKYNEVLMIMREYIKQIAKRYELGYVED